MLLSKSTPAGNIGGSNIGWNFPQDGTGPGPGPGPERVSKPVRYRAYSNTRHRRQRLEVCQECKCMPNPNALTPPAAKRSIPFSLPSLTSSFPQRLAVRTRECSGSVFGIIMVTPLVKRAVVKKRLKRFKRVQSDRIITVPVSEHVLYSMDLKPASAWILTL